IEPAIKAKKPSCGANPPSRAVAICSGIAIAASVRPAKRSRARNWKSYPLREANTGQTLPGRGEFAEPEGSSFTPPSHDRQRFEPTASEAGSAFCAEPYQHVIMMAS